MVRWLRVAGLLGMIICLTCCGSDEGLETLRQDPVSTVLLDNGEPARVVEEGAASIDPVQVVGVDVGSLTEPGLAEIAGGTGGSIQAGTDDLIGTISDILNQAATQPIAWPGGPYAGKPEVSINFNASGSYDPTGDAIVQYEWDFDGDGVYDLASASPTVEHTYTEDYEGAVVLRVTGAGGTALGSTRIDVNAEGSAPQGDAEPCALDEAGVPIIVEDGLWARCTVDDLPTEDLEGVFEVVEGG